MEQKELLEMREKIDQELFLESKRNFEKAETDTTPYAGVIDGDIVVSGDPNNTEVKKQNYTARFLLPKEKFGDKYEGEDVGRGYIKVDIEYKDVFPSAKQNMKFTSAMAELVPFYRKLQENGDVEEMSDEEALKFFASLKDDVIDAMYRLVTVVLEVDEEIADHMIPTSALYIGGQIIKDFPSVVSQADLFFDSSIVKA